MQRYLEAIFGAVVGLGIVWIMHKVYGIFWNDNFQINRFGSGGIRGPEIFAIGYCAYLGFKGKFLNLED